jgi:uncharacterized protein
MKKEEILPKIKEIIEFYPQIKLVYLFGSLASGKTGPLSDVDLAFYISERDKKKLFDIKLELMDKISRKLGTDKIDIVILNLTDEPELKFNIIKDGELIYSQEPFKIIIEPKILNEYFDFYAILKRYKLTKA